MTRGRDSRSSARRLPTPFVILLAVVVGGFIASALVRYSPGFEVDENSWNPQISAQTQAAIHARREYENRLPLFYVRYLAKAVRGNFGESDSFHVPVTDLLRQRAAVTQRSL